MYCCSSSVAQLLHYVANKYVSTIYLIAIIYYEAPLGLSDSSPIIVEDETDR